MSEEKPELKEIFFLVHPFFEIAIMSRKSLGERLSRTEAEFAASYLSKWGSLVKRLARNNNAVLLIEKDSAPEARVATKALTRRFISFAETQMGKSRVLAFPEQPGNNYERIAAGLCDSFRPARIIRLRSFGEWRAHCVVQRAQSLKTSLESNPAFQKSLIGFKACRDLSVPKASLPDSLLSLRRIQRAHRKDFRRRLKQNIRKPKPR